MSAVELPFQQNVHPCAVVPQLAVSQPLVAQSLSWAPQPQSQPSPEPPPRWRLQVSALLPSPSPSPSPALPSPSPSPPVVAGKQLPNAVKHVSGVHTPLDVERGQSLSAKQVVGGVAHW